MCGKTCIYKCIHTHTDTHKHWLSSLAHISHTDTLSHFPNHVVFCHCSDLLPDRYLFLFRQGLCLCVWMCICVSGCVSAIWVVIYSTKSQREFIQQDQEDVPGLSCPNNFRGKLRRTCTHAHTYTYTRTHMHSRTRSSHKHTRNKVLCRCQQRHLWYLKNGVGSWDQESK